MIDIPKSTIERFVRNATAELSPQIPGIDGAERRLIRIRDLALKANFLTHLDWNKELPHPEISASLLVVAANASEEIDWLSEKITTDNHYGCWALPLPQEYDSKNRARYPTLTAARFNAKGELAHRFVVRRLLGELATEQHLDHLCRVHACCNPTHLEIVNHTSNVRRGNFARRSTIGQGRLI